MKIRAAFEKKSWPLKAPFRFAGHTILSSDVVTVTLTDGEFVGHGEATGVIYHGETPDSICADIAGVIRRLGQGMDRAALARLLPACGARNAMDCALWDLECKRSGQTIWEMLGIHPTDVSTCNTVGLEPFAAVKARAAALSDFTLIKVKVDQHDPLGRLRTVRDVRPDARIIIDVNGAWDIDMLMRMVEPLCELGVELIEQPLPPGADEALAGFTSPIPLCADESCFIAADVPGLANRYGAVNIKLDKTGGLTEALALMETAEAEGLDLMVGNMIGSSLSAAPSFIVAQRCGFVDLDGPLALERDHPDGMTFTGERVSVPSPNLWG